MRVAILGLGTCVMAVELGYIEAGSTAIGALGAKDGLVVDTKLGFSLVVLSEIGNNRVRVASVRVATLHVSGGSKNTVRVGAWEHHRVGLRRLWALQSNGMVGGLFVAKGRIRPASGLGEGCDGASREHTVVSAALESRLIHLTHRSDGHCLLTAISILDDRRT